MRHCVQRLVSALTGWTTSATAKSAIAMPAVTTVNGRLILNTFEAAVYRLSESGDAWEKVGTSQTKRMVARLVPYGSNAILVGGASRNGNIADLELLKQ